MSRLVLYILTACLPFVSMATQANQVQYTYRGQSMTPAFTVGNVINDFSPSDRLSFSFIVTGPLASSTSFTSPTLLDWNVSDSHYEYGKSNATLNSFSISTDSLGNISNWSILGVRSAASLGQPELFFSMQSDFRMLILGYPQPFNGEIVQHTFGGNSYAAFSASLGTWTVTSVVPEPATVWMLLPGILLVAVRSSSERFANLRRLVPGNRATRTSEL